MLTHSEMSARTHRVAPVVFAGALLVTWARGQATPAPGGPSQPTATQTPADAAARARQHFQRGRELYQEGAYREAIAELEAAHTLDPRAKDLVYNLSIVNEKLGQIDAAIQYLHGYLDMELEAQERVRAEAMLKRLEGSKKEVVVTPLVVPPPTAPTQTAPPETPPAKGARGRIDAATVAVGGVAVAGLAVGTVFGIKALTDRPSGLVAGKNATYTQIQSDESHAHTEGIVADIGFGVGVAAAAVTAYLYFGRTKSVAPPPPEKTVSLVPVVVGGRGAVLVLGGSF
jgi:tetratricopeptide (TPR) repeat protein